MNKDHPDQAVDTDVPDEKKVDRKAFKALQENYEGDTEEETD